MAKLFSSKPIKRSIRRTFVRATGRAPDHRKARTILFHDQKVAYIYTPKVACSSVKTTLLPLVGREPNYAIDIHAADFFDERSFEDCASVLDDKWFVFAIVRHPMDRLVSAWQNKCDPAKGMTKWMKFMGFRPGDSFERFLRVIAGWPVHALDPHIMPQTEWLSKSDGWPVQIFRFENLSTDWPAIAAEINRRGGTVSDSLGVRNRSAPRDIGVAPSLSRIQHIYRNDFARYGYDPWQI